MTIPDEATLITALKAIRVAEPTLAWGKVLKKQKLKEENNCDAYIYLMGYLVDYV
jgi:hypothetical protein